MNSKLLIIGTASVLLVAIAAVVTLLLSNQQFLLKGQVVNPQDSQLYNGKSANEAKTITCYCALFKDDPHAFTKYGDVSYGYAPLQPLCTEAFGTKIIGPFPSDKCPYTQFTITRPAGSDCSSIKDVSEYSGYEQNQTQPVQKAYAFCDIAPLANLRSATQYVIPADQAPLPVGGPPSSSGNTLIKAAKALGWDKEE